MRTIVLSLFTLLTSFTFGATTLVSVPTTAGTSAGGNSFGPAFSADGHHLIFVSHANNLASNDDLGLGLDIFTHDLVNSNTVLVSVSTTGLGGANADANFPSVSSNGQFIAFASRASNLVPSDTNDAGDVFVRDVVNGITRLISVDVNGNSPIDPAPSLNIPLSGYPLISADGRWIVFESRATNLIAGGAPLGSVNIYGRDTWSNVTVLVSANTNGGPVSSKCELTSISASGRYVAFISTNLSISTNGTNSAGEVFVRDLQTAQTVCVSDGPGGFGGSERKANAQVSADGTYVVYFDREGSGYLSLYRANALAGTRQLISGTATNESHLAVNSAGDVVYYNQGALNGGSGEFVYVWTPSDLTNLVSTGTLVSASSDGRFIVIRTGDTNAQLQHVTLTNGFSSGAPRQFSLITVNTYGSQSSGSHEVSSAAVVPDGKLVAFDSAAGDLTSGDLNAASDVFLRDMNLGVTELVTKAHPAKPAAAAFTHSFLGLNSISADGRFIVSTRYDDPSAYRDTNGWTDVFFSDLLNGTSLAASINTNVFVTNIGGGGGFQIDLIENTNAFQNPVISADGSTIYAVRRAPAGGTRVYQQFTAEASSGAGMRLASRGVNVSENGNSYSPSTSSNGLLLVFTSTSSDLVADVPDNNSLPDVYLRRTAVLTNGLLAGTNELVSISMSGAAGDNVSSNGMISPDGRWVVFESRAQNLTTNFAPGSPFALFARDLWSNTTHLVSVGPTGNGQWGYVPGSATISGNSRYVAFSSGNIYLTVHDLHIHTSAIAENPSAVSPSLSHTGRFVAFVKQAFGSSLHQIYARDLQASQSDLVSASESGAPGNGASSAPVISADGRYVIFQSKASNLNANDTNGFTDIFVRDRLLGATMLVGANAQGASRNAPSTRPVMAMDGRTVVFQSFANDLVAGDYNDKRDIFVLKLGGADTDGDGMDDDWEVTYFSDLDRNGSGDFDDDGISDLEEFIAGTDPADGSSFFRVLTVTPAGGGSKLLFWFGNPGRSYRAEFKNDLSATNWTALTGTISWNGSTASITDPGASGASNRFYRVVRLP